MQVAEIELFKILKTKFTEAEAESIISNFESKINSKFEDRKEEFSTKQDITNLEINIANLEMRLTKQIAETRADTIKWMFIFWVGTIGVLSGIIFAMLHAYIK